MLLSDQQIARLVAEPKPAVLARDLRRELNSKTEPLGRGRVATQQIPAKDGGHFVVRVRQNALDAYDFSVILTYQPEGGAEFILRRHNGPSHQHRNPIEQTEFRAVCHIHQATERYQLRGSRAEHYAEPTTRFHDVASALACMLEDCNFEPAAEASFPGL